MEGVAQAASAVFWGVLILSLLVFVHEGGHYLLARLQGVRVTEFFLGMPCRFRLAWTSKRTGTTYGVTPLLLGGYTRICGMEGEADELLAPALDIVMREGRVSGEAVASELDCEPERAYALLGTLSDWAAIEPYYDPELGEHPFQRDWPVCFQTSQRDANHLTRFDRGHDFALEGSTEAGQPHATGLDADEQLAAERSHTYLGRGFFGRVAMLLAGPAVNIIVSVAILIGVLCIAGVDVISDTNTVQVAESSLAQECGLESGSTINAINGQQMGSFTDVSHALSGLLASGEDFTLDVTKPDGQQALVDIRQGGQPHDKLGVSPSSTHVHLSVGEAVTTAFGYIGTVVSFAARLIVPTQTMQVLDSSSSVVGISVMASKAAQEGVGVLLNFCAMISMSLGVMNLLPIPPLDGGKILIEIIQLVRRKPLSIRAQNYISYAGLAFFLFVFIYVVRLDVMRFILG